MRLERSRAFATIPGILALAVCASTAFVAAQEGGAPPQMTPEQQAEMEAYMKAGTPGPQHAEMAAKAGTYDVAMKSWMEPGAPPMESTGSSTWTMALDGRVMIEDFNGSVMGMPFTGRGMHGYDNVSGKYWATWTDSMSTGVMVSEGTCDDSHTCTYVGTWNDPIKKAPVTSRMVVRPTGPKTQLFEMYGPGRDGKEMKMMELTYTKR